MSKTKEYLVREVDEGNVFAIGLVLVLVVIMGAAQAIETASIIWLVINTVVLVFTGELPLISTQPSIALLLAGFAMCMIYGVEGTIKRIFEWMGM